MIDIYILLYILYLLRVEEPEEEAEPLEEDDKVEVMLCGCRMRSTVRGRALRDLPQPLGPALGDIRHL